MSAIAAIAARQNSEATQISSKYAKRSLQIAGKTSVSQYQ
jgi:hypothetical protein